MVNNAVKKSVERQIAPEIEKQTDVDVDINLDNNQGSFSIETEEGDFKVTTTTKGELPKDFPSDLEVYPGAEVKGTYSMEADDGTGSSVTLATQDSIQAVSAFYVSSLENNGWVISGKLESEEAFTAVATKDNRSAVVGVGKGKEGTIISLSYGTEQQPQE